MPYDVFISYRRDGGDAFAMTVRNELRERGLRVFHDVEALRSGKFNEQLYEKIEESGKFVLILSPNALDRCIDNPNDWVRLEIEHALSCGKTIIPIMLRGFTFPENLPSPLDEIHNYQGLEPRMDHTFEASMDYLVSLIIDNEEVKEEADQDFDMRDVRTFASCGNETTVFKVKKYPDGDGIHLTVNFEKTRLRNEIPEYAGAYYVKHPVLNISHYTKISFQACSKDLSIDTIWVEIKPQNREWMHESFEISLNKELSQYDIFINDFTYPKTANCMEEITFVIKPGSFVDENHLKGEIDIANIRIR